MAKYRLTAAPQGGIRSCYAWPSCSLVPPSNDQGNLARGWLEFGDGTWNQEFYVTHVDTSGTIVNGIFEEIVSGFHFKTGYFNALGIDAESYWPVTGEIPFADVNFYASKLAALVNPNRQAVNLPVAILELRELPDLIRDAGTNYIRAIGDANLRFQFGVLPMVRDFLALLDFNRSVERRIAEFNSYAQQSRVRKRELDSGSVSGSSGSRRWFSASGESSIVVDGTFETNYRVWGYCNVSVPDSFRALLSDSAAMRKQAAKALLGFRLSASTVWQALPWSWLVDWFVNVGDFLEAHAGGIPTSITGIRICQSTVTRTSWTVSSAHSPALLGRKFWDTSSTKRRRVVSTLLPGARPPLLTQRQLGILSSIALVGGSPSYLR